MKRMMFFILILFLCCNRTYSQLRYYYIKFGNNISQFQHEGTKRINGVAFGAGIGYDANDFSHINGFVNLEVLYSQKHASAENKIWRTGSFRDDDYIIGDINMSIGYLELPLKVGYYANIGKRSKCRLFTGFSVSIPIINDTKTKEKKFIYYYPEKKEYEVDYERDDNGRDGGNLISDFIIDNIGNTNFGFHLGAIVSWSFINFELRYLYAISNTRNFINLAIHDKVDTFYILLGVKL